MKNGFLTIFILCHLVICGQPSTDSTAAFQPRSETYIDSSDGTLRTKNLWLPNGKQTIMNGFGYREYEMWGQVRVYYYQNGLPNGPVFFYDSTKSTIQKMGYFKNEHHHGVWTEFYNNGQIRSIIEYSEGDVQSDYQTFYESGQLKEQYDVTNGRNPSGKYVSYYESGTLRSTGKYDTILCDCQIEQALIDKYSLNVNPYKSSIPVGRWTDYYPSGAIKQEIEYSNDCFLTLKLDTISADPIYDLVIRGSTVTNNCPTGIWKTYNENGDLIEVIEYENCEIKKKHKVQP